MPVSDRYGGPVKFIRQREPTCSFGFCGAQSCCKQPQEFIDKWEGYMPGKILVVEDEKDIADMVKTVLEARGHIVLISDDGMKALDIAKTQRPDVIITDLLMPGITGLELCQRIREDADLRSISLVVITSVSEDSSIPDISWKAVANCDEFVSKPFDPYELADRVERILSERTDSERDRT